MCSHRTVKQSLQDFTLTYGQVIPKPFCSTGPLGYLRVTGPLRFVHQVKTGPFGRYSASFCHGNARRRAREPPDRRGHGAGLPGRGLQRHRSSLDRHTSQARHWVEQTLLGDPRQSFQEGWPPAPWTTSSARSIAARPLRDESLGGSPYPSSGAPPGARPLPQSVHFPGQACRAGSSEVDHPGEVAATSSSPPSPGPAGRDLGHFGQGHARVEAGQNVSDLGNGAAAVHQVQALVGEHPALTSREGGRRIAGPEHSSDGRSSRRRGGPGRRGCARERARRRAHRRPATGRVGAEETALPNAGEGRASPGRCARQEPGRARARSSTEAAERPKPPPREGRPGRRRGRRGARPAGRRHARARRPPREPRKAAAAPRSPGGRPGCKRYPRPGRRPGPAWSRRGSRAVPVGVDRHVGPVVEVEHRDPKRPPRRPRGRCPAPPGGRRPGTGRANRGAEGQALAGIAPRSAKCAEPHQVVEEGLADIRHHVGKGSAVRDRWNVPRVTASRPPPCPCGFRPRARAISGCRTSQAWEPAISGIQRKRMERRRRMVPRHRA